MGARGTEGEGKPRDIGPQSPLNGTIRNNNPANSQLDQRDHKRTIRSGIYRRFPTSMSNLTIDHTISRSIPQVLGTTSSSKSRIGVNLFLIKRKTNFHALLKRVRNVYIQNP